MNDTILIERNGIVFRVPKNPLSSRRYDPVTLLLLAGTALTAGGQVYSGMGAAAEGKSQEDMAKYNAALAEQQADQIEAKTALEQRRQAEQAAREMGTLRAGLGASGAVTTEGTPLLIQATQASELELENMLIGYEGATAASQARSQAAMDRMQGKIARQVGRNARTGSFLQAGGTLLTGFGAAKGFSSLPKTGGYTPEGQATLLRY